MSRGDFWSRRKAAVAEEEAEAHEQEAPVEQDADAELSDAELLEKYELPDPDTLKEGDDFSAFMSTAIPERLRNRALRKLWLTNPTLANVDGLVDYGDDFTDAATVVEDLQTVYRVGKGMVQKLLEPLEEDGEVSELAEVEAAPEDDLQDSSIPTESLENDMPQEPVPHAEVAALPEPEIEPNLAVKPRMRFTFSQNG